MGAGGRGSSASAAGRGWQWATGGDSLVLSACVTAQPEGQICGTHPPGRPLTRTAPGGAAEFEVYGAKAVSEHGGEGGWVEPSIVFLGMYAAGKAYTTCMPFLLQVGDDRD
jgi:hypothetical protein